VLFLWGVWAFLPQTLAVIEAWEFEFSTCGFVWLKPQIGLGFWTRQQYGFCLLATRGRPSDAMPTYAKACLSRGVSAQTRVRE